MVHSEWYNLREVTIDTSKNIFVNNTDNTINDFQISKLLLSSSQKIQTESNALLSCLINSTVNINTSVIVKPLSY